MTHSPLADPARPDETRRLAALSRYEVMGTPPEPAFDRIAELVGRLLNVPLAAIHLLGAEQGWFKAQVGSGWSGLPREVAACRYTILGDGVFVVPDLTADARFAGYPLLGGQRARAYIGAPLITPDGWRIGTLCAHDLRPRTFAAWEQTMLAELAAVVVDRLELRRTALEGGRGELARASQAAGDPLTGLLGRAAFSERARAVLRRARHSGTSAAALRLDLHGLARVRATHGPAAGDALLREVGRRLRGLPGAPDAAGHFGEGEFALLLPDLRGPHEAERFARRVLAALEEPADLGGVQVPPAASLGLSLYPHDAQDLGALLLAADAALEQARSRGGGGHLRFHTEGMHLAATRQTLRRERLARAIEAGDFRLHYQPQVELPSGRILGLEALLRWPQPGGGWAPPGDFIPLAEDTGLIVPLGQWALREACAQWARWAARGAPEWYVAVNVSPRQWEAGDFLPVVQRAVGEHGLPPGALILEITETMLLRAEPTDTLVRGLENLGVRLAVDDFGTGYSNLSRLAGLPFGQLKLDRSLVRLLGERHQGIVEAVTALGQHLGATVVGEGVETAAQAELLQRLGCRVGQGFYYGRPGPPEAFLE